MSNNPAVIPPSSNPLIASLTAVFVVLGLALLWQFPPTGEVDSYSTNPDRGLASVTTGKTSILGPKKAPLLRHTSKLRGPLSVTLSPVNSESAIVAGRPFTLEAQVVASENLDEVNLKWILPEGVKVSSGQAETTLANVLRDEPQTVVVTLVSESEENQQIHLQVSATLRGMTFGESAQFNTTDQEYLELQKAELLERSKEDMATQQQKVFH